MTALSLIDLSGALCGYSCPSICKKLQRQVLKSTHSDHAVSGKCNDFSYRDPLKNNNLCNMEAEMTSSNINNFNNYFKLSS